MKVLLITIRSDFGGGPRHVNQLIDSLSDNVELYLAYPQGGEPYAKMWDNTHRIKKRIYIPYRKFSIKALFALRRFIQKNGIDIVHSHGNGAGIYSRFLKVIGCKAKIIHTFHGISDNYQSKLKKRLNIMVGQILKNKTDLAILVSEGEWNLGMKMDFFVKEKAVIIYNGIEVSRWKLTPQNQFKIVTLSRFDYPKNMDFAYQIASEFKDNPNVKFVWVGDGDDYERLRLKAQDECLNIEFVGFSNEPMKYLSTSSIYLSTSRFEGLPYALIEAASIGLPIVASDVKGNNEVVKHGETGFLYNTKEEAYNYINSILKNKELHQKMSIASVDFYEQNFTQQRMIEQLVLQYNKLLAK